MAGSEACGGGVKIIDATLREGVQTPGVTFDSDASRRIAAALSAICVDMIECGHPAAGRGEQDRIAAARSATDLPILAHARADRADIRAVARSGAEWVGVFIGVNEVSRTARLSARVAHDLGGRIVAAMKEAKDLGLCVRFTVEDASRTPMEELEATFARAIDAGADRICWADTVGLGTPETVGGAITALKSAFPSTPLELHLHDDRGLALASALSGAAAGADWVSTTVNGLGERCGVVDTLQLLLNLRLEGQAPDRTPSGEAIAAARDIVAEAAGIPVSPQRAFTGAFAFKHTSRLHRLAAARDRGAYEAIDPRWTGAESDEGPERPQSDARPVAAAKA
ncbi:MAG: homocitrate synthase [Pseudomonadota bacterium]